MLGACSGKLLHYIAMQHCPLTLAGEGGLGDAPEKNFRGQCCTNKMEVTGHSLLSVWLVPPLERVWEVKTTVAPLRYFPMITISLQTRTNIVHRSMLLQRSHGLWIELHSAEPRGLRIQSLQQVCWRRDESKGAAC